jgi:hypothetical protein
LHLVEVGAHAAAPHLVLDELAAQENAGDQPAQVVAVWSSMVAKYLTAGAASPAACGKGRVCAAADDWAVAAAERHLFRYRRWSALNACHSTNAKVGLIIKLLMDKSRNIEAAVRRRLPWHARRRCRAR